MIIRKANFDDKSIVIDLVIEAIEDLGNIYTGYDDINKVKDKMKDLFCYPQNRFSYDSCIVAEIDGNVAGSIMAYPGSDMSMLNELLIEKLRSRFELDDENFVRCSTAIIESKEAFDDEYYIDNLAVLSQYRGRGLSKLLIDKVEKDGFSKGYNKISILADLNNNKAYNIYKKLGYKKDCELDVLGHRYHHLVKII